MQNATMLPDHAAVYAIVHIATDHAYVGSAVNVRERSYRHLYELRKGKHDNPKLQNAFNKYGEDAFGFRILDYCEDTTELTRWEQQWMDSLHPWFNLCPIANSRLGAPTSAITRAKLSVMMTLARATLTSWDNITQTPEQIAKRAAAHRGQKRTPEQRARISEAMRGRKLSTEHRARLSAVQKGKTLSPEHRAKQSVALKGKPWSQTRREAEEKNHTLKGKPWSQARREAQEKRHAGKDSNARRASL